MEKKLIKLFDPAKAERLIEAGFEYMTENIGSNCAYVFCVSQELLSYLQCNFECNDFFLEDMLRF